MFIFFQKNSLFDCKIREDKSTFKKRRSLKQRAKNGFNQKKKDKEHKVEMLDMIRNIQAEKEEEQLNSLNELHSLYF